jgi:Galactose oxidase, central domain/Kelch motif
MKYAKRLLLSVPALFAGLVLAACSGVPQSASSTGGSGNGTNYTISGQIAGLTGTGLVLQDNGGDNLTITQNGAFTFKTELISGAGYAVTVLTQPSSPTQNCTVTNGSGKVATSNITSIAVTCAAPSATIGGTVAGLTGTGLVLQDNGGDSLTITANGSFTFKTAVTGAYAVTVLTQPTSPNQICTVTNGSGTPTTATVTNVAVNCVAAFTISGTVNGLVGSGMVLADNGTDQLPITSTNASAFTFKQLVPTGGNYAVTISTQPTSPSQTCKVVSGTGTATANVTNVTINCPAVTFSVGGSVVGLQGKTPSPPNLVNLPLTDNSFEVQNNLGNTLTITQNGPFQFTTSEALNDQYEISIFHGASTQSQGCTLWNYKGVVTANVTSILVDCGHNDWTWIDGTNKAGIAVPSTPQYGAFPTSAPPTVPNPFTNTPGARYGAVGWKDTFGSLFLFGGLGWELAGKSPADTLPLTMSDLWVCDMSAGGDFCEWQLVGGYDPTKVGGGANPPTMGSLIIAAAQSGLGAAGSPRPRLGAAAWTDKSGNFWLFGGSNTKNFLDDLWKYNPSGLTPGGYTTTEGVWTMVGGSLGLDQPGNYTSGTLTPGSRTNSLTWTDSSGNLWLFGGYGYDGAGTLGFLNDLWEYTGGNWVFVSGGNTNKANQNGIYGSQGVAASSNMPGGRQEAVGWTDANGNLWLFGGEGEDSTGTANGILNDLWMYNIAGNQWTWVTGSNTANQTGTYPAQPVTGPVNTATAAGTCGLAVGDSALSCPAVSTTGALPGSRWGANSWIDANGNLWLFGGWGLDSTGTNGNGALNDLWVYTPNSTAGQPGTWAWIKGSNTGAQNGIYGNATFPYTTYENWTPGGRSNATQWVDSNNQLWLFGGLGYDSTSTTGNGYLNDMWRYLPYP